MPSIEKLGPEPERHTALRRWFEQQELQGPDRLEEGAKTLTQLITGIYGTVFAVLALADNPAYLASASVRWLGALALLLLFCALGAATAVLYPRRHTYQDSNITQMEQRYHALMRFKRVGLRVALGCFLIGLGLFAGMLALILWA